MSGRKDPTPPNSDSRDKQPTNAATQPCPEQKLLDKVKECDGGLNILEKAKQANGGKEVNVVIKDNDFGGKASFSTGSVIVRKSDPPCTQIETVLFEMGNWHRQEDFKKVSQAAANGDLSREDFIRGYEKLEYDNVQDTIKATEKCKEKWGCKNHTFDFDGMKSAKNFNDYYKNYLSKDHKEYYGKAWDRDYKAAYDKKHPTK